MLLPEDTFEYVAVIPDHRDTIFSCDAPSTRHEGDQHGRSCSCLVGTIPRLYIEDAGPTPNPGPHAPATQRSRLRLIASDRQNASVAEASFVLDQGVISALRAKVL